MEDWKVKYLLKVKGFEEGILKVDISHTYGSELYGKALYDYNNYLNFYKTDKLYTTITLQRQNKTGKWDLVKYIELNKEERK